MNRDYPIYEYGQPRTTGHLRWRKGSSRQVFSGSIFSVSEVDHSRDDGRKTTFLRLDTSDWVNVCALTRDSGDRLCLIMVRQFRPGVGSEALELPGGMVDARENPKEAAARELFEETGFVSSEVEHLGSASPNAAFMGNTMHCFLARNLEFQGSRMLDENEVMDVELVPLELIRQGRVPEFMVNGVMAIAWYYLSTHLFTHGEGVRRGDNEGI